MGETEKFQPLIVWQYGKFRIVKTASKKFEIENCFEDAMGQPSWRHFCNIADQQNSVSGVLWLILTQPNQGDKMV